MTDLRAVFPTESELPLGWRLTSWWDASRGTPLTGARRVYLNGGGTDHELRFLVFPPTREGGNDWRGNRALWPDCDVCHGAGRVRRPATTPGVLSFLKGAGEWDAADENGLRRCHALNCTNGHTEPIYGAANCRMRIPDFPAHLLHKTGHRGLSAPTRAEILEVMEWCDAMLARLLCRHPDERYP